MTGSDSLRLAEVLVPSLEAFKVVGDQCSLLDYDAAHPPRVHGEWSAMYLQFDEAHALGTTGYRWDMGYGIARLLHLRLQDVTAIVADAAWLPDGSMPGDEKAARLKEAMGLPPGTHLMEALEHRRQVMVCRETEGQWELIVPRGLLQALIVREEVAIELLPNAYGATGRCRRCLSEGQVEAWRRFDDAEALREVPPPTWISEALTTAAAPSCPRACEGVEVALPGGGGPDPGGSFPFVAEWDEEGVFFYQAFNEEIADWALQHQRFGGPQFKPTRMTWIKPSFAWMLYRAGYGDKDQNQARVLKVKLSHGAVAEILGRCTEGHGKGGGEGRVQWDPSRSLSRASQIQPLEPAKVEGERAIQIGLKGALSEYYVDQALAIADVTALAHRVREAHALPQEACEDVIARMLAAGDLPEERHYGPRCPGEIFARLSLRPL